MLHAWKERLMELYHTLFDMMKIHTDDWHIISIADHCVQIPQSLSVENYISGTSEQIVRKATGRIQPVAIACNHSHA